MGRRHGILRSGVPKSRLWSYYLRCRSLSSEQHDPGIVLNADRSDIARDKADIQADRRDIAKDRVDIHGDARDLRADAQDVRSDRQPDLRRAAAVPADRRERI